MRITHIFPSYSSKVLKGIKNTNPKNPLKDHEGTISYYYTQTHHDTRSHNIAWLTFFQHI